MDPSFFGNPQSKEDIPWQTGAPGILFDMHNAVTRLNLWEWLRTRGNEFPTNEHWIDPNVTMIMADPQVSAFGHTGMTMSWCLGQMRFIATHGWVKFIDHWVVGRENQARPAVML